MNEFPLAQKSTVWKRTFFFCFTLVPPICLMRKRTVVVTKQLGLIGRWKKSNIENQTENLARTTVGLAYSTMLALRSRGHSNHVATKTLHRLALGQKYGKVSIIHKTRENGSRHFLGRAPACKGAYSVVRLKNFIWPGKLLSDQRSGWELAWWTLSLFLSSAALHSLSLSFSLGSRIVWSDLNSSFWFLGWDIHSLHQLSLSDVSWWRWVDLCSSVLLCALKAPFRVLLRLHVGRKTTTSSCWKKLNLERVRVKDMHWSEMTESLKIRNNRLGSRWQWLSPKAWSCTQKAAVQVSEHSLIFCKVVSFQNLELLILHSTWNRSVRTSFRPFKRLKTKWLWNSSASKPTEIQFSYSVKLLYLFQKYESAKLRTVQKYVTFCSVQLRNALQ